ncbi:MAG: YjbH domain-containing protein, partial [Chlamydiales bacterium]|nr:YjbH domain-containing protein [Chlamydiales bacterium]
GLQAATVLKRNYTGLGFQTKVRRLNGFAPEYEKYVGLQYFFDIYYDVKPIDMDVHIQIGQFLAKDKGARFEVTKYFPSGLRFSIWYTLTNASDMVNGSVHHDKGIAFTIPFDVFLSKSSRNMIGYAMAAWLRDAGATAATGKPLFPTIESNRIY